MIRVLIIALNLFAAWIISIIAGAPSATVTAPTKVQKGETFTVNVKINPNGNETFLRYTLVVPNGWTVEKTETDGSTFMFEQNTVKFLWSRVGQRNELNVSFKLTPPANEEGTFEFPCKLDYSPDNKPEHVVLDPLKVIVGKETSSNPGNYVPSTTDSTANPAANLTVSRVVPTEPVTGQFMVDVTINKGDLGNYIKLQDSLPAGFSAQPVTNDGGVWTFENNVVRIEWYNPNKTVNTLHVQYKVIVSPDMSGSYTINGHVSYLENMDNKLVVIPSAQIQLKENPALVDTKQNNEDTNKETTTQQNNDNSNKTQNPVTDNTQNTDTQNTNTQEQTNPLTQEPTTNTMAGVSYRIQVAAMVRRVPVTYYESTYSLGTVNAEQVDGLNKYTTGSFTTYQDARNSRETVKSKGVAGPFVVAYNNGKRITVQEALMITSQKWIR